MLCGFCSKEITGSGLQYCSLRCGTKAQWRDGKATPKPSKPKMIQLCLHCGAETTNPKYCSKSCSAIRNGSLYPKREKLNPIGPCLICQKPSSLGKQQFCSQFCSNIQRILEGIASAVCIKRTRLLVDGIVCSICLRTTWEGQPIPLVLDHINGHADENTWENTRLVCGNCDMLLPTYKGRNKGSGRYARRDKYHAGLSY